MRSIAIVVCMMAASGAALAQQWEVGGLAGGGFVPGVTLTAGAGKATTGFQSGGAFGAFVGQNLYPRIAGEIHYAYMQSNLKLESGSTKVTFSGHAHVIHYDLIFHTSRKGRAQFFAAAGGGLKVFRGTGREAAYQPLSQFAYLTRTQQLKPMVSVGGGVKMQIAPRMFLRTEVRDYITPFPKDVITPAPGTKVARMLHDLVPMAGISFEY
jgi:hypothetical protein